MKDLFRMVACLSLVGLGAGSLAGAEDEVRYQDRAAKKEARISGTILGETPGQIRIKPIVGNAREIPAPDILDIDYQLPGLVRLDYRKALSNERNSETASREEDRRKSLAVALKTYQELLPKISEPRARRHMEFKIAKLMVRQADDDPSAVAAAIERVQKFKKDHPGSWQ